MNTFARARAAVVGGLAAGSLAATLLGLAPTANAATAAPVMNADYGPPGCGVNYETSRTPRGMYVEAANACDWGQRCIKVHTGYRNGPHTVDGRVSGPHWVGPGATVDIPYGEGRSVLAVFYCD